MSDQESSMPTMPYDAAHIAANFGQDALNVQAANTEALAVAGGFSLPSVGNADSAGGSIPGPLAPAQEPAAAG
ncbi:hypothetical protein OROMI_000055 [Orobanche minor]